MLHEHQAISPSAKNGKLRENFLKEYFYRGALEIPFT